MLLLDISNDDEYIWTTSFTLPPPPPPPLPPPSPSSSSKSPSSTTAQPSNITPSNNKGIIAGSVIGSLIGGSLLTIGGFFLYRRYYPNPPVNPPNPVQNFNHGSE